MVVSSGVVFLPIFLTVLIMLLIIPISIAIYVFRDASKRGMNAVLWTLIALLVPTLIGFIIYLLIRGKYPDLKCPQCESPIREEFIICPKCGNKLRPTCPNCNTPIQPDWELCPSCSQHLSNYDININPPNRHKDKGLVALLITIVVIPLLIIIFGVVGFIFVTYMPIG